MSETLKPLITRLCNGEQLLFEEMQNSAQHMHDVHRQMESRQTARPQDGRVDSAFLGLLQRDGQD